MNLKSYQTKKGACWLLRNGQVPLASFGPCSRTEATRILRKAEQVASIREAERALGIVEELTVEKWVALYEDRYLAQKAPKTQRLERRVLKRLVALHGDKLLLALTKGNLEDYKAMRAKVMHARVARRLSPWSVNSELRILKCVLNRAVDDGYLMISPAARGFKFLRQDKPVVRRVAWETIFSLLRAARRPLNVVLLTAVKCGLRPGEVLKLQVTDVMEATDFLRITSTPDHPTKTRAERLVPLPDDVRAWLQWLVQWVVNPRTGKALVRDPLKQPYLFCHRNGIPIKSMKTAFTSLCAHVGIVGLRLKDLRKVYASALAEANVHPEKVRLATGHSDVKVLLEHYTTVELRDVTRVVRSWPCLEGPPT